MRKNKKQSRKLLESGRNMLKDAKKKYLLPSSFIKWWNFK